MSQTAAPTLELNELKNLELLRSSLKELKACDGKFEDLQNQENIDKLIDFINLKFENDISDLNIIRLGSKDLTFKSIISCYDICIQMTLNKIIQTEPNKKNFNCISILSLLKNKVEPNFNILPKVYSTIPKVGAIHDLIFGSHPTQLKIIHLVEYFRQKEFTFEQFINHLILVKVIEFFDNYERKSSDWYNSFIEENLNKSYNDMIIYLIELFEN